MAAGDDSPDGSRLTNTRTHEAPVETTALRVKPRPLGPFEHQPEFPLPLPGKVGLFILDLVLVPLRLISIILLLCLLWLVCRLLLIGATPAMKAGDPAFGPLRTWLIRGAVRFLGKPICWSFALVVSEVPNPAARTNRGIIIANHTGYVEILLLAAKYAPSVVAKSAIAGYPLIGTIARALQCIFVDRKDPADRRRVMEMMHERAQPDSKFPPLLLFPEGTTENGTTLLRFQKGIFTASQPIQSIAIKAHFIYFNSGWVGGSMLDHVLRLLTRLYHPLSMQELPLYTPNEAERKDPILFADNVCQTMANALLLPISQATLYDNPELVDLRMVRPTSTAAVAIASSTDAANPPCESVAIDITSGNSSLQQRSSNATANYTVGDTDELTQPTSARKQGWLATPSQQPHASSPNATAVLAI